MDIETAVKAARVKLDEFNAALANVSAASPTATVAVNTVGKIVGENKVNAVQCVLTVTLTQSL